jgi:hypothetical protein
MLGRYHLHPDRFRLLYFTIIVPVLVVWFALFYGYHKLRTHGRLIRQNRDGRQVTRLANGLFVLAIGLPLGAIISAVLKLIARSHHGFTGAATIIPNYIDVLYALVAFIFITRGTRGLYVLSHYRPTYSIGHTIVVIDVVLGVIFCDLIARAHRSLIVSYHMTYSWVILTLAIPYMYTWFLGLLATAEMYAYSKQVAGDIYRKGWYHLAIGLGIIIAIDILIQYLSTLTSWLIGLSLLRILSLLYVLLLLFAMGFIVVALGSKELMKIEQA